MADTAVHADEHVDHGGHYSSTGLSNNKLAMWMFLGSECLLFGASSRRTCCTAVVTQKTLGLTRCGTFRSHQRRVLCC